MRPTSTLAAAVAALILMACSDAAGPARRGEPRTEDIQLYANVGSTPISKLAVEVSAADIPTPLTFNLTVGQNNTAAGTLSIPIGLARTLAVRAFDVDGHITHDGSTTVDVRAGQNPPVTITLLPRSGRTPLTVVFGSLTISFNTSLLLMLEGETRQLGVTIANSRGELVAGTAEWATSNPAIASIDANGLVTANVGGSVRVSATFAGVQTSTNVSIRLNLGAISADQHSCGIGAGGRAYCWGDGTVRPLGDGLTEVKASPSPLWTSARFVSISTGMFIGCALEGSGQAHCWGLSPGDGSTLDRRTPVPVAGGTLFGKISAGYDHACAISQSSSISCWGSNTYGQLGAGAGPGSTVPVAVTAPSGVSFAMVSAGNNFTCAISTDSRLYCWGNNSIGQLGDGTTTDRAIPTLVSSSMGIFTVDAGGSMACATVVGGQVYCWGRSQLTPLLMSGTTTPALGPVSVGDSHACALTNAGAAWCWGDNTYGQLGNASSSTPIPTPVTGAYQFTAIAAGARHTCATTTDGAGFCWGANESGQLGVGAVSTTGQYVPSMVVHP